MKNINQFNINDLLNSMDTSASASTPTLRRENRQVNAMPFIPCVGMTRPIFEDSDGIESYFNCEVLCNTLSEISFENSNSDNK